MASGYQNIESWNQAAPTYTPYAAQQPYADYEVDLGLESPFKIDQPLSKKIADKFPNTRDLWNRSLGNQFKITWDNGVKQANSIKGRVYCLAAFLTTPVSFVFDTIARVCEIASETFALLKDICKFLGARLRGDKPDSTLELGTRLIKIMDLTASIVLSPVALAAQETRLFIGVLNPAWTLSRDKEDLEYIPRKFDDDFECVNV